MLESCYLGASDGCLTFIRGVKKLILVFICSPHTHTHARQRKRPPCFTAHSQGGGKDGDKEGCSHIPQARFLTAEGAVDGASG